MEKKKNLTKKILLGLVLGAIFGIIANLLIPQSAIVVLDKWVLNPVGKVFINGIKMVVVPLVLFSLIVGAASIGDVKKLGRVGGKIVIYYLATTAVAITIALLLANLISPGIGISIPTDTTFEAQKAPFIMDTFVNMVSTNPIKSMADGNMLQIILFAIITGVSIAFIGKKAEPLLNIIDIANQVMIKIIGLVMMIAPYAVFALIARVIASQGVDVLLSLIKYMLALILALGIQAVIVYSLMLFGFTKLSRIQFFKKFWPVMAVAFSTSSSSATLPVTIETVEEKLGVKGSVASFTLPLGATINMDGTAMMQGVAAIFIAQAYGIPLGFSGQLMIILTATLASIGTAAVPGAGLVMLSMVLQQVGLPVEGIAIVLSVDRILDMTRTAVNVTGDAVGSIIVAKSENEFDVDVFNSNEDIVSA